MANNTFVREDGVVRIAQDFQTTGGKKLSDSDTGPITPSQINSQSATNGQVLTADGAGAASFQNAGGGVGPAQSPLNGTHKALVNNTNTNIFSVPLDDGDGVGFSFNIEIISKKGSDIGVDCFSVNMTLFNIGDVLTKDFEVDTAIYSSIHTTGITGSGAASINASLSGGVATISVNPGNVASSPDSIDMNIVIHNPHGKVITLL